MRRTRLGLAIAMIAALSPTWLSAGEQEDKEFAKQVATMLKESGQMKDYSVGVKCKNGTVWLAGRVTDQQQLSTALHLVNDLEGVSQIVNNLKVDEAPAAAGPATHLRQLGSAPPRAGATAPAGVQLTGGNSFAPAAMAAPAAKPMRSMPKGTPRAFAPAGQTTPAGYVNMSGHGGAPTGHGGGQPIPAYVPGAGGGIAPVSHDQPHMPNHAWPSYAAYPNYAALTYPKQYSASAFPFIGPFYPYPQVPLGWRKVSLEWDDGWWFLDFDDQGCH